MKEQNVYEKIIDDLNKEYNIEEIVSFNETNLNDKLQNNPYLVLHFNELYLKEKNILEKLEEKRDQIVGECFDHYRFNYDKQLKTSEIEKYYLVKDVKILKINEIIKRQNIRVQFFDICRKSLEKQQWSMKSFIDATKAGI